MQGVFFVLKYVPKITHFPLDYEPKMMYIIDTTKKRSAKRKEHKMKKMYTVMNDHGEERPDLAVAMAETREEALPILRDMIQSQDEVFNYVIIDDMICQFEGLEGFLDEEKILSGEKDEPTHEDLMNPNNWNIDYANIWDACELEEA